MVAQLNKNNMPKFLEEKLVKEYGKKNPIVYATMNKMGVIKGNKETAKNHAMERKHQMDALKRKSK